MKPLYVIVLIGLGLVACGDAQTDKSTTATADVAKDSTIPSQTLRIATESSFKPFSYVGTSGELSGFEIDLANALCAKMDAVCQINAYDWDSLIPSLNAGRFDAVMAGMSVTDERQQVVDFSEPYFNNTLVLVAKKDEPITIDTLDGKTVATQQATVSASYLENHHPQATVKAYDKQDNAYLDLAAGRVDAMLSDVVPMNDWLASEQGQAFEIKGVPIDIDDKVAIAIKKGDMQTKTRFDTALAELKASGEYDAIVAKYFDANSVSGSQSK